ncbi:tetratricopeptide repeat protein [Candidatus Gottesmanbacteria bacterium]|nr:tetratricopeptide repeat protein [Candidatus Gottesmanbacteria bacterium]
MFFGLALTSSEKAIILPGVILALLISFWPRFNSFWPWLLVFFAGSGLRTFFLLNGLSARVASLAADYPLTNTHFNSPFLQVPIAITTYLNLIFWPEKLTLYHSDLIFSQQEFFVRVIILAIILLGLAVSFFKSKQIFFWGSFFLISLLPTINPYVMAWVVAERYVYFGLIGILAVAAIFLIKIFKNTKWLWLATGILVLVLGVRTIWRNFDWQSEDTLWLATAKYSLLSPQNHNNLGDYYGRRGDFVRSAQEFQTAIDLLPGYADAYHNLGNTYLAMGKLDLALESYKSALKYRPSLWQSQRQIEVMEKLLKKETP